MGARFACLGIVFCVGCASSAGPQQAVDFASPVYFFDLEQPLDFAMPDLTGVDLTATDMSHGTCPSGTIPPSVNTLYAGDTGGGTNIATDTRTSWTTNPDHALLFVAPTAGTYKVSLTSTNQFGTDCGVVLRAFGTNNNGALLDETSCPVTMGTTATLDGAYAATPSGTSSTIDLNNAQHVLMWVSCASTAITPTMVYDLKVVFQ